MASERIRRLGVLLGNAEDDPQTEAGLRKLTKALQDLGWSHGRNIWIDYRWGASDPTRIKVLAKELVDMKSDLILAHSTPVVAALQRETNHTPIVFVVVTDPVGSGFVVSLARPGGNITGFTNVEPSLSAKWVELLKEIAPHVSRAALMFNPNTATYFRYYLEPFEKTARTFAIEPFTAPVNGFIDIERSIAKIGQSPNSGLVLLPDIFTAKRDILDVIISLAAQHHIPTIYPFRYMVDAGGLISYGIDTPDIYRRAADYIDRILKGAKPAELPVQMPTLFELAVNLKTAKSLGLTMPDTLLARADEVIE
jgi:putative tryptophan/tyrosine transport system substrate-binding protein